MKSGRSFEFAVKSQESRARAGITGSTRDAGLLAGRYGALKLNLFATTFPAQVASVRRVAALLWVGSAVGCAISPPNPGLDDAETIEEDAGIVSRSDTGAGGNLSGAPDADSYDATEDFSKGPSTGGGTTSAHEHRGGSGGTGARASGGSNYGGRSSLGGFSGVDTTGRGSDPACIDDTAKGPLIPLDLYFMVSRTTSMDCPIGSAGLNCTKGPTNAVAGHTRWTETIEAIQRFAADPDNAWLSVGFGFFPPSCPCQGKPGCSCSQTTSSCDPDDYATASSDVTEVSTWTPESLKQMFDRQTRAGRASIATSLAGALAHASDWAKTHSERRVAVIYASDGTPDSCSPREDDADCAAETAAAYRSSPGIPTYVLGVGPNRDGLLRIAQAAGTVEPYSVDTDDGDSAAELTAVFNSYRNRALSCEYRIQPIDRALDYAAATVEAKVGASGTAQHVNKVTGEGACSREKGGWYFDDQTTPTTISLCHATCQQLITTAASTLRVRIGCASPESTDAGAKVDGGSGDHSGGSNQDGNDGGGGDGPQGGDDSRGTPGGSKGGSTGGSSDGGPR